jgi:polyisoprenoid-binding protein YceI
MKRSCFSLLIAVAFCATSVSSVLAEENYKIDPVHSSVGFKIRHLFSYVSGKFIKFEGAFTVDFDHPEKSSVTATIQTASIDTGEPKRDDHLRGPDFFDAAKFPTITFKSKSVKSTGKDKGDIVGDFTMHGVTREVTLHAKFLGKGTGMGGEISGWQLTTEPLKRTDYGLNWSKAIEGTAVVGEEVEITIEIEAHKT